MHALTRDRGVKVRVYLDGYPARRARTTTSPRHRASSVNSLPTATPFAPARNWDIPAGHSAIAEVYPALWSRNFDNEGRTGDQHDAYSIAAWLSRADRNGSLAAFLKPYLTPPECAVAQVEGWILGVPGIRAGKERNGPFL